MKIYILDIFRDKKKTLLIILVLFIVFLLFTICFYTLSYYKYSILKTLDKNVDNRTLEIIFIDDYDKEKIEKLNSFESIIKTYEVYSNFSLSIGDYYLIPKNINELNDYNIEDNEVILSENIASKLKITIGDSILINNSKEFVVRNITKEEENTIFLNNNPLEKLAESQDAKVYKYCLIIDSYNHIEEMIEIIEEKGLNVNKKYVPDEEISKMEELISSISYGIYLMFGVLIIILIYVFKYIYKEEEKNISLLKILGYKNIFINNILFLKESILFGISLLFNIILYLFTNLVFSILGYFVLPIYEYLNIIKEICIIFIFISVLFIFINKIKINKMKILATISD